MRKLIFALIAVAIGVVVFKALQGRNTEEPFVFEAPAAPEPQKVGAGV